MLAAKSAALTARARCLRAVRAFFDDCGFLEIETPVRIPAPAQELHIDAEPSGDWFLRTSPELHMKRLLAAGYSRIYQIGPCFRQGERGNWHRPEYTMLEWYRAPGDYQDILRDTHALLTTVAIEVNGTPRLHGVKGPVRLDAEWMILTVRDAFRRWAHWDPTQHYDADRFDLDIVEKIEPALRSIDVPVILIDYPQQAAALARRKGDDPSVAERWECYVGGIELANAYSELTDYTEQSDRFATCARQRATLGKTVYPADQPFLDALKENRLPPCGGIALGLDRLIMCCTGATSIEEVTAF